MQHEIIVMIGYDHYAFTPEEFAMLASLAQDAVKVHRPNYTQPYVRNPEDAGETFIKNVQFEPCDLSPLEQEKTDEPKAAPPVGKPDDDIGF